MEVSALIPWLLAFIALLLLGLLAAVFLLHGKAGRRTEAGFASATQSLGGHFNAQLQGTERALNAGLSSQFASHGERVGRELSAAQEQVGRLQLTVVHTLSQQTESTLKQLATLQQHLSTQQTALRGEIVETMLSRLAEQTRANQALLQTSLAAVSDTLSTQARQMSANVDARLNTIAQTVNTRLDDGFKKTNETFANVMARLATIDEAQKKIDGLTTNVVSLQELLGDKRSRGAFGEVQLEMLVRNVLPPQVVSFQATLSNGTRADCVLSLPEPTGRIAIDSKFPLENYHRSFEASLSATEREFAQREFGRDVKKHIEAIASKYIIPGETSEGAMMFVPAEAVFAEIHAHQHEAVEFAQKRKVWIVSPTTLMAVLNTVRAVLRDVEMREQTRLIQDAIRALDVEFGRFADRMDKLAKDVERVHKDVSEVQTTSGKIARQFQKISQVELPPPEPESETALLEVQG